MRAASGHERPIPLVAIELDGSNELVVGDRTARAPDPIAERTTDQHDTNVEGSPASRGDTVATACIISTVGSVMVSPSKS